jgi:alcohol dehydrogenase
VQDGSDLKARTAMAYASLISGIGLANAGLGVVHGFASPLGGFFHIPHGVVCGTLMGPATSVNVAKVLEDGGDPTAKEKYARVGELFSDVSGETAEFYCHALVEKLAQWSRELKIPYLSDYGITENDLPKIIEKTGIKNNPVYLTDQDLKEILLPRICSSREKSA